METVPRRRSGRFRLIAAGPLLLGLLFAHQALGATVELGTLNGADVLLIEDAVGERNEIQVSFHPESGTVWVTGFTTPLSSTTCAPLGGGFFSCAPTFTAVVADLGAGDDSLTVALNVSAYVDAGAGADKVTLGSGPDGFVDGGPGYDEISGGPGNEQILGGDDDDLLDGGGGTDVVDGGPGADTIGNNDLNPPDGPGTQASGGLGNDKIYLPPGGGTATGGEGNDTIWGGTGNDQLLGGEGNDSLSGFAGNDTLDAGPGDDVLEGKDAPSGPSSIARGAGSDLVNGGDGVDVVRYDLRATRVTASLDDVRNDGEAGENDLLLGIENIDGGGADDVLSGNAGPNAIQGDLGNDTISGLGGNDLLNGGSGDDAVNGGDGEDAVNGGPDNDAVDGGPGADQLHGDAVCSLITCGGGNDVVQARDGFLDQISCGAGGDRVVADQLDVVATDLLQGCETVERATIGGTAPPPPPPAPTTPISHVPTALPLRDITAPNLSAFRRTLLRGRVTARFRLSEAARTSALLYRLRPTPGRPRVLRPTLVRRLAVRRLLAGQAPIALGRLASGRYRLRITLLDAAGNRRVVSPSFAVS
jgi:Ca2+-binding RTX toxin-like protein